MFSSTSLVPLWRRVAIMDHHGLGNRLATSFNLVLNLDGEQPPHTNPAIPGRCGRCLVWAGVGRCGTTLTGYARRVVVAQKAAGDAGRRAKCSGCEGCSGTGAAGMPHCSLPAPPQPRPADCGPTPWRARYPWRGMYLLGRRAPRRDKAQGLPRYESGPHSLPGAGQGRPTRAYRRAPALWLPPTRRGGAAG